MQTVVLGACKVLLLRMVDSSDMSGLTLALLLGGMNPTLKSQLLETVTLLFFSPDTASNATPDNACKHSSRLTTIPLPPTRRNSQRCTSPTPLGTDANL
jgi:hypothetical protein